MFQRKIRNVFLLSVIPTLTLGLFALARKHEILQRQAIGKEKLDITDPVPSFQSPSEAIEKLPLTLSPKWFQIPSVREIYSFAATDRRAFCELPCYCYCDRAKGHKSLLDCFVDDHGAHCSICLQEALYAHRELKKGTPIATIRANIIKGAWRATNVGKAEAE